MTFDVLFSLNTNSHHRRISNRQKLIFYRIFYFLLFFYASVFLTLPLFSPFVPFFLSFSPFCKYPFCSYERILLCVVNVSSLLSCARNGERSKKGPGRNGGALCPEFVPRRSPFSFTRDDKSGVALTLYPSSHPPWPFPYRPAASILAYTQNYRDRT